MFVKVRRAEIKSGERKDGTPYTGTTVVVILPDKEHAASLFVGEEVCDPCLIEEGKIFDMYRDEKGYVLVFDEYVPESK